MALSIQLTRADSKPYYFGSNVCGIVKFATKRLDHLQAVSISFTGRTTATVRPNQSDGMNSSPTRQSSGCLFRQHIVLLCGETSLDHGDHVWPFSFSIPRYAQYCDTIQGSHGFGYFEAQDPFLGSTDAEVHLLPPSFRYNGRNRCTVAYFLEARAIRPATLLLSGDHNLTYCLSLNIQHRQSLGPTSTAQETLDMFQLQTFPLLTQPDSNMTKRLKKVLKQSKPVPDTERVDSHSMARCLQVHIETPKYIATRSLEPVKIFVHATERVVYNGQQEEFNGSDTNINLRSFSVDLIQHTIVRAGGFLLKESSTLSLTQGSCNITLPCLKTIDRCGTQEMRAVPPFTGDLACCKRAQEFISGQDDTSSDTTSFTVSLPRRCSATSSVASYSDVECASTSIDIGTRIRQTLDVYRAQSPCGIVSAFATYNCFRAYELRVQLTLAYNGKSHKLQSKAIPVSIVEEQDQPYARTQFGRSCEQLLTGFETMCGVSHPIAPPTLGLAEGDEVLPPYSRTVNARSLIEASTLPRTDERR